MSKKTERERIRQNVLKAFDKPKKIQGLTTKDIAVRLSIPKETARLHLERYKSDGFLESVFIGKTKFYQRKKTT